MSSQIFHSHKTHFLAAFWVFLQFEKSHVPTLSYALISVKKVPLSSGTSLYRPS